MYSVFGRGTRSLVHFLALGVVLSVLASCKPDGFINKVKYRGEKYVNTCETFTNEVNRLVQNNNDASKLQVSEYDNSDFDYFYLEPGQFEIVGDTLMFRLDQDLAYAHYLDKGVAVHVNASYQSPENLAAGQGGDLGTLIITRDYYIQNYKPFFLYKIPLAGKQVEGKQISLSFAIAQYDKNGKLKKYFCETDATPIGTAQPACCNAANWQSTLLQSVIAVPPISADQEDFVYKGFTGTIDVMFQESSSALKDDSTFSVDIIQTHIEKYKGKAYNVNYLDLTGYASPGGKEAYNQKLSQRRADALKEGLKALNGHIEGLELNAVGKGEDWDRVKLLTKVSSLSPQQKEETLIICNDESLTNDQKEALLRKVAFWDVLVEEVLIKARHTFAFMDFEYGGNLPELPRYTERHPITSQSLEDVAATIISAKPYTEGMNVDEGFTTVDEILREKASPNLYAVRATYHLANDDIQKAISDLETAGRFRDQNASKYTQAVQGYQVLFADNYTADEKKSMLQNMDKLAKDNPGDRTIFFNRAVLMDKVGNVGGALAEYDALLNGYEPTPVQLNNRGVARLKANRVSEAEADFMAATQAEPNLSEAWFNLAATAAYKGFTRKTLEYLDKAVAIKSDYKDMIFNNPVFSVISEDPRFDKYRN
ncbi:MAG: OmpA family protein [Bacteroidota bacterium]